MLKSSSRSGYEAARQDSSSEESDAEETPLDAQIDDDPPEEDEGVEEDPPEEDLNQEGPEEQAVASLNGIITPSNVTVDLEMTAVQPEEVPTAEVQVPLAETNVDNDDRAEPPQSNGAVSNEPSEIRPITSARGATSDIPEDSTDGVKLVSYKVRGDEEPPKYEDVVSGKEARDALQDVSDEPIPIANAVAPMELTVIGEGESRPSSREAWPEEEEETGDVENARNEDIEAANEVETSEEVDVPAYIPDPLAPVFRRCRTFRPGVKVALTALLNICLILFVILIALSVQKLDYDEMGFKMARVSKMVYYMEEVFEAGRYFIGPRNVFKSYPAIAQSMEMTDVRIYTTDPLRIAFRCQFYFQLSETELGLLEDELDVYYLMTVEQAAIASIKNSASRFSLDDILEQRAVVEREIHEGLQKDLQGTCCLIKSHCQDFSSCQECYAVTTNCTRGYHVEVPFFNLLDFQISESILERKKQVLITALAGEEEEFRQTAALVRKTTEKLVADIRNEADFISANATAFASMIRTKAEAEVRAIVNGANSQGLSNMYSNLTIVDEGHKASVHWLRTLRTHQNLISGVHFEEYMRLTKEGTV